MRPGPTRSQAIRLVILSAAAQRYEDRVEASRERREEEKEPEVRKVSARGSAR